MPITDEDEEFDAPDFFSTEGECWAWKRRPAVIGGPTHTHVCRLPEQHDGDHTCAGCGDGF